jgi:hypothetical protein
MDKGVLWLMRITGPWQVEIIAGKGKCGYHDISTPED